MSEKLKNKKVIIWAHNAHLMKKTSSAAGRDKVLGEFFCEDFGAESICVGQFTGSGNIEHMPGQRVELKQHENSIEDYILNNVSGVEVFQKNILTFRSGIDHDEIVLAEHFDAWLLHEKGSAPVRL